MSIELRDSRGSSSLNVRKFDSVRKFIETDSMLMYRTRHGCPVDFTIRGGRPGDAKWSANVNIAELESESCTMMPVLGKL